VDTRARTARSTTGTAGVIAIEVVLTPRPGAGRRARELVTEACARWGLPDLVGSGCLVVTELVGNAVRHAGTSISVRLHRGRRYLHFCVRDASARMPVPATAMSLAPDSPRGLLLVAAVSDRWGWRPDGAGGKVVWAMLRLPRVAGRPVTRRGR
jgi:anti-sigma regulatory factor (Ser/Thr protein kinase)